MKRTHPQRGDFGCLRSKASVTSACSVSRCLVYTVTLSWSFLIVGGFYSEVAVFRSAVTE